MQYSTITGKGQVTVPSFIREKLHLNTGSKVEFILQNDHIVLVPLNKSLKRLKGILPKPSHSFTNEELNECIKSRYDSH